MTEIVCTVGYPGAGKSVAVDVAESNGIPAVVMGDQVRARAEQAIGDEIDAARDATNKTASSVIGKWATEQREQHGQQVVAEWTAEHIHEIVDEGVVMVDGVRSSEGVSVFRDEFESVQVVYVETPFEQRLSRLRERGRDGEDGFTASDLEERDAREDSWGVSDTVERADMTVSNTGSLEDFKASLRRILLS